MDALLSIDTTKGNRILNARGIAITPTVKDGYLLRTSEDLLSILESTTGCLPKVLPLAQQDITPYGNNIWLFWTFGEMRVPRAAGPSTETN